MAKQSRSESEGSLDWLRDSLGFEELEINESHPDELEWGRLGFQDPYVAGLGVPSCLTGFSCT